MFFLLNGFSEDHYTHALEVLKEKLDALPLEHCEPTKKRRRNQDSGSQGPEETEEPSSEPYHTHLLVDFELAQAKAFTKVFNSKPHGCFFHFRQCMRRKLLQHKVLNHAYHYDLSLKTKVAFNTLVALALVRKVEMSRIYEEFKETSFMRENFELFLPMLGYFERQWVRKFMEHRKGRKLFPVKWNQFKFFKSGTMKTTSSLESWHKKFATIVGVKKPNFNNLIDKIRTEQETNETILEEIRDGRHKVIRRKKDQDKYALVTEAALKPYLASKAMDHITNIAKLL